MKKLMFIILIFSLLSACLCVPVYADGSVIYYVDAGAAMGGNGTKSSPFKKISDATGKVSAGDTVEIASGNYNEKIVFCDFAGAKDNPVTIKGADGAKVNVSSYDSITGSWTLYKDNIYKTNIGIRDDISHAVRLNNGNYDNLVEARWPNANAEDLLSADRALMDDGSDHYGIYDDALPEGDWNGSTVYLWTGYTYEQYVSYARTVSEYKTGESLKFNSYVGENTVTYTPREGDWYYLTNSLAGLDSASEYYYDKSTGDFYVIMPDGQSPENGEIAVKTRSSCVELWSSSNINFENLNMYGGIIIQGGENCVLDNVNAYYADFFRTNDGYNSHVNAYNSCRLIGNNNTWINSEIAYTMSSGILINGNGNTIRNCNIHDVDIGGGYNACITVEAGSKDTYIGHCDLSKSGRFLIYFLYNGSNGDGYGNTVVEYNDCYNAMYLTNDGGAIYGYHRNGDGIVIRNNWVHDSLQNSCGIYLDNDCSNFKVYRNVVWNVGAAGICINTNSTNNFICNNTVFNCGEGIQGWPKTSSYSQLGTVIENNAIEPIAEFIEGPLAPKLITNEFSFKFGIDENFVPTDDSILVDKGTAVSYVADVYKGSAPDIGAYENGGIYWTPGCIKDNMLYGDTNSDGYVNAKDVFLIRKYLAEINTNAYLNAADVNVDFEVNAKDILLIRKYLACWDVTLGK